MILVLLDVEILFYRKITLEGFLKKYGRTKKLTMV